MMYINKNRYYNIYQYSPNVVCTICSSLDIKYKIYRIYVYGNLIYYEHYYDPVLNNQGLAICDQFTYEHIYYNKIYRCWTEISLPQNNHADDISVADQDSQNDLTSTIIYLKEYQYPFNTANIIEYDWGNRTVYTHLSKK